MKRYYVIELADPTEVQTSWVEGKLREMKATCEFWTNEPNIEWLLTNAEELAMGDVDELFDHHRRAEQVMEQKLHDQNNRGGRS